MYFITVIDLPWDRFDKEWDPASGDGLLGSEICWGYFSEFDKAKKVVLENSTDIYEFGSYNLAVIEEVGEGVPAMPENEWWFSAKPIRGVGGEIKSYEVTEIQKPKRFEIWRGWALS